MCIVQKLQIKKKNNRITTNGRKIAVSGILRFPPEKQVKCFHH